MAVLPPLPLLLLLLPASPARGEAAILTDAAANNVTASSVAMVTAESVGEEDASAAAEEEAIPECEVVTFVIGGLITGSMCVFGLVGNTLSVLTFWPTVSKNATSLLLIGLALYDDGVCLVWLVNSCVLRICALGDCKEYLRYQYVYMSLYGWPLGSIFHLAGTWTVVLVTFHRYIAVCHPHSVNKYCSLGKARLQVVGIGIASFLINIPRLVDDYPVLSADGVRVLRRKVFPDPLVYMYLYEVAIYYILIYIVPVAILLVLTSRLLRALARTVKKREQMTRAKQDEHDLTLTLIVVVVVFMICQTMNPIRRLLSIALDPSQQGCGSFASYWSTLSSLAIVFNSCGNFIIYCIFSPRFRKTLKRKVCVCGHQVQPLATVATVTTHHPGGAGGGGGGATTAAPLSSVGHSS